MRKRSREAKVMTMDRLGNFSYTLRNLYTKVSGPSCTTTYTRDVFAMM